MVSARIFILFMKGKYGPKGPKLNSSPVYCSRLYGNSTFRFGVTRKTRKCVRHEISFANKVLLNVN